MTLCHAFRRSALSAALLRRIEDAKTHLTAMRFAALAEAAHHLAGGDRAATRDALRDAALYRRTSRAVGEMAAA